MFSSRTPKLVGAALMDLAEAMLRPVDDEKNIAAPARAGAGADRPACRTQATALRAGATPLAAPLPRGAIDVAWLDGAPSPTPAAERARARRERRGRAPRRPHRLERSSSRTSAAGSRRAGTVGSAPQPCTTPVASRTRD